MTASFANCCDCGAPFARDDGEEWKRRCLKCWVKTKTRAPRLAPVPIDLIRNELREQIRALLMLCHPDKHAGSALATKTTQWLLGVRNRLEDKEPVS